MTKEVFLKQLCVALGVKPENGEDMRVVIKGAKDEVIVEAPLKDIIECLHKIEKKKGVSLLDKEPIKKNYHHCGYCGKKVQGPDEDVLCEDCRMTFGHTLFSEL